MEIHTTRHGVDFAGLAVILVEKAQGQVGPRAGKGGGRSQDGWAGGIAGSMGYRAGQTGLRRGAAAVVTSLAEPVGLLRVRAKGGPAHAPSPRTLCPGVVRHRAHPWLS